MLKWSCDNCGVITDLPPGRMNAQGATETVLVGAGDFEVRYSIGRKTTDVERKASGETIGVEPDKMGASMRDLPSDLGFLLSVRRGTDSLPEWTGADLCDPCKEYLSREAGLALMRVGQPVPVE